MDEAQLRQLLADGKTHAEIAAIMGYTRPAISYRAKKLGITPNKAQKPIDVGLLRSETSSGISFSEFARRHNHTLAAVSKIAKKRGIKPPGSNHKRKKLPDQEILNAYQSGTSLDALKRKHGVPVSTIKRHLRSVDPDIQFRSMNEALRPALLNDKEAFEEASLTKSYRTISRELGVKLATVTFAAKKFGLEFSFAKRWDKIEYETMLEMYVGKLMLPQVIADELGYPYGVVLRQLKALGFPINKSGGYPKGSKHPELNDKTWLIDHYINKQLSINQIAKMLSTSQRNVLYHLRRHEIKTRTKSEYLKLLMQGIHGHKSVFKGMVCDSQLEKDFLQSLGDYKKLKRSIEFDYAGSYCYIDFCVDDQHYEVKPKSIATNSGVERRRAVKQLKICEKNKIDLIVWTPSGIWNKSLTDDDIYYAMNWKLFFDDATTCAQWLLDYGFHPPQYSSLELAGHVAKLTHCKEGCELNANFQNVVPWKFTTHFFPHYWSSTHKNYIAIDEAWKPGNVSVLKKAVAELWEEKKEINIYGLVNKIRRRFKDFATVSIFKPWIAAYIYDKYLPNGGRVVDPSCGWGGRFMATVDRQIEYVGYDLNPLAIESHKELRNFLGSRVLVEPSFEVADSSVVDFGSGDLLFTSPPYDDAELYFGIDSLKTKTQPIIENIMKFDGMIVLNVPKRQETMVLQAAADSGREIINRLEMKTASFMGRERTFEPILIIR